jgi:chromatin segregation and condensation protein Rec8/ScpA/Scc1 (kleisin family)
MPLMGDNLTDAEPDEFDDDRYRVRLQDVFEGPMDLLVHLIKKAEVDIYDIPISQITAQYLEYLEWMQQMNIDFAGDFVLMASTLTHIKSRMLLPAQLGEEEEEDPRLEITRPLLEYLRIKSAAEQLAERNLLGETTFTRRPDSDILKGRGSRSGHPHRPVRVDRCVSEHPGQGDTGTSGRSVARPGIGAGTDFPVDGNAGDQDVHDL